MSKESNEMPKLEAGMILEVDTSRLYGLPYVSRYLYIKDSLCYNLNGNSFTVAIRMNDVLKIYKARELAFCEIGDNVKHATRSIIWEKKIKTPTELKIEELEKSVDETVKQIKELKETL